MGDWRKSPNIDPRQRDKGSNHRRPSQRELGRAGRVSRSDANVPSQSSASPRTFGADYVLGAPQRPSIKFDNGFLDKFKRRRATTSDYLALAKWKAKLEIAEALRSDLTDATAAYRHFLEGSGQKRTFSYERYVQNDQSGRLTLQNAIIDIQDGAEEVWAAAPSLENFNITGGAISCGGSSRQFPYPATENWQKAIGGHVIWLSGKVSVSKDRSGKAQFRMDVTIHAEDRYNFNPDQHDIATGIPDSDNGNFEVSGLGNQYDQAGTLNRNVRWERGKLPSSSVGLAGSRRQRMPGQNRRLRNRL